MVYLLWVSFPINSVTTGCVLCEVIKQVKYYICSDWKSLSCIKQKLYSINCKYKQETFVRFIKKRKKPLRSVPWSKLFLNFENIKKDN